MVSDYEAVFQRLVRDGPVAAGSQDDRPKLAETPLGVP
jgi:hypothetical protein